MLYTARTHRLLTTTRWYHTSLSNPLNRCIVFSGQGTISNTMGNDFHKQYPHLLRPIWTQINHAMGQDISSILFPDGASNSSIDIRRTDIAQPLIYGVCTSMISVLLHSLGYSHITQLAQYTMGHSLGEFTSLTASNALSIYDTAKLLHIRGESMYNALPNESGGMCVLQPISHVYAVEICNLVQQQLGENTICTISNINSSSQIVLSGHRNGVERAVVIARTGIGKHPPIKLARLLNVTSPFHCQLMRAAEQPLNNIIQSLQFNPLKLNLITNVDAQLHGISTNTNQIKQLFVDQLTRPVQWYKSVLTALNDGVREFVEISPGKVLCPLIDAIAKHHNYTDIHTYCISNVPQMQTYIDMHVPNK